jgi:hypothetical protein
VLIDSTAGLGVLLTLADIDEQRWYRQSLFRPENVDPARRASRPRQPCNSKRLHANGVAATEAAEEDSPVTVEAAVDPGEKSPRAQRSGHIPGV